VAAQAVERQPPIGFFRGFVLERQGEHRDTLDLKSAMHIVIELARLYALAGGLPALNTVERLRAAAADGLLSESSAGDLVDAFEFLGYLRLRHQAGQVTAGRPPDNRLAPDSLTSLERKHLRDVFGILRTQQQGAALAHHTQVMS